MTNPELAKDLAGDEALWRAWTERGVDESTVLTVDFTFYASKESRARALVAELEKRGYQVEARSERTLFLFKGWVVEAHMTSTWSLYRLQESTREHFALAQRYGALYDGPGAEMP